MEKVIWVVSGSREDILFTQRKLNSTGSMRAYCMLSREAVKEAVHKQRLESPSRISTPSLVLLDYEITAQDDYEVLSYLRSQEDLAGVPLVFMMEERSLEMDEECYARGATVVLRKPLSESGIQRIETMAWQHEVTKNYEQILQKQTGDLQAAREIMELNNQLQTRNEVLYQVFGKYFSDKVLELILENPDGPAIGGEKREVTVMMADLRGFTPISEDLGPEELTELLNSYFGKMLDIIISYHGTVIEFLGDAILAVFGAPLASDTQTEDAVAAAITMQNAMEEVNDYCTEKGQPVLEMGIAIHRGEVLIGNIGSERMMRYNVVGRAANECSRIESCCVGGQILVSGTTLAKISCPLETGKYREVIAKGLHVPLTVCEVLALGGEYNCRLEHIDDDVLVPVEKWIMFNLYPIEDKVKKEMTIAAQLREFSGKRAVIEMKPGAKYELEEHSDVEIFASGTEGKVVFTGVNAKIISREDQRLTLHFTHVNPGFRQFAKDILEA